MPMYDRFNRLTAQGNLSYLEFLRIVQALWKNGHPGIDLVATGTKRQDNLYPVIYYRLDLRKPFPNEPKPRVREQIDQDGKAIVVMAQRFQNLVTFTAMAQLNPELAESLIEEFENFMIEFQPVYKELGVSELVYARRNPDVMDDRQGLGVNERSVTYMLTTEKIIETEWSKLESVTAQIRLEILSNNTPIELATPNIPFIFEDDNQSATPNG
jgi:hypothetical protein